MSWVAYRVPTKSRSRSSIERSAPRAPNPPRSWLASWLFAKFLKGLSEREVASVFASLGDSNRALLLALCSQYRDVEQSEQDRKPEILRS